VIQQGEFDWRTIFEDEAATNDGYEGLNPMLSRALGEFEEEEDRRAARLAAREEAEIMGEEREEFEDPTIGATSTSAALPNGTTTTGVAKLTGDAAGSGTPKTPTVRFEDEDVAIGEQERAQGEEMDEEEEQGGFVVDYMLKWVKTDWEFFSTWKL
jgi:helicase SWR1